MAEGLGFHFRLNSASQQDPPSDQGTYMSHCL